MSQNEEFYTGDCVKHKQKRWSGIVISDEDDGEYLVKFCVDGKVSSQLISADEIETSTIKETKDVIEAIAEAAKG